MFVSLADSSLRPLGVVSDFFSWTNLAVKADSETAFQAGRLFSLKHAAFHCKMLLTTRASISFDDKEKHDLLDKKFAPPHSKLSSAQPCQNALREPFLRIVENGVTGALYKGHNPEFNEEKRKTADNWPGTCGHTMVGFVRLHNV